MRKVIIASLFLVVAAFLAFFYREANQKVMLAFQFSCSSLASYCAIWALVRKLGL